MPVTAEKLWVSLTTLAKWSIIRLLTIHWSFDLIDRIRIATRKSPLALWQAEFVRAELLDGNPGLVVDLVALSTRGDKLLDTALSKIGGKGLFVKELETALLDKRADIAVHSLKDVPMELPVGLTLGAVCQRADPRDGLVANHYTSLNELPVGAIVGTSSLRRRCQLLSTHPSLDIRELRGNVNTRLAKLDSGEYQALILACAGLDRLSLAGRISARLDPQLMLPAVGQGVLAIECRSHDPAIEALLAPLHDADTADCVTAERALNRHLEGGCQVPIAAYAELDDQRHGLRLRALVGSLDGVRILTAERKAPRTQSQSLGIHVAEEMLAAGARDILAEVYGRPL